MNNTPLYFAVKTEKGYAYLMPRRMQRRVPLGFSDKIVTESNGDSVAAIIKYARQQGLNPEVVNVEKSN